MVVDPYLQLFVPLKLHARELNCAIGKGKSRGHGTCARMIPKDLDKPRQPIGILRNNVAIHKQYVFRAASRCTEIVRASISPVCPTVDARKAYAIKSLQLLCSGAKLIGNPRVVQDIEDRRMTPYPVILREM